MLESIFHAAVELTVYLRSRAMLCCLFWRLIELDRLAGPAFVTKMEWSRFLADLASWQMRI